MSEERLPSSSPWIDSVKQTGTLRISLYRILERTGWDNIFRKAIKEFESLSTTHSLGVTFTEVGEGVAADVEVRSVTGDFDMNYPPDVPEQRVSFNGKGTHGHTLLVRTEITLRPTARNAPVTKEWQVKKAYIHVPATPMGGQKPRLVGDGVKLAIAVHEMIHACGLTNALHTTDDIFVGHPSLSMGARAPDDQLGALGETYTFPGKPGENPRTGHRVKYMPPIYLYDPTAAKIKKLWAKLPGPPPAPKTP